MSAVPTLDRNRAEKQLLVKLACQQIIYNDGLQPTTNQWDDIASKFNASEESRSKASKTELLKLWKALKAEAEHARQNYGDKVLKNPLLGPIDRLSRFNSKSGSKAKKAAPVIPQDLLRRSKRKLYSANEETDGVDIEGVGPSDEVADVQAEFLDHLSFKRPKIVSKRTENSRKSSVVIEKGAATVDEKQSTKSEEKCPPYNTTDIAKGSENGRKSCLVISAESSNMDARNIQSPNVSQPRTRAISCTPPRPGTPYPTPTFVRGTTGCGAPVYFRLDNINTETAGNGVNLELAGGLLIDTDTGFNSNDLSCNAGMVRNHVTVNNNVASIKVKNNLGMGKNDQGLVANNHGRVTNITKNSSFISPLKRDNPHIVTVSAGMVTSNAGMVTSNAGMVTSNAGMMTNSNEVVMTRNLVRIPRLKSPVILQRPNSPASSGNSQLMAPPFSNSTPEKTFLIPPSLLKDSTNIFARNEVMPQIRETRLMEEFQEIRIRQAKELQEVQMKIYESQIMMDKKMAEQSQELHDAKMKTEALIAEQNCKFAEEKMKVEEEKLKLKEEKLRLEEEKLKLEEEKLKLEEEKLKQSLELDQKLYDAKLRYEDEIAKQRNELQAANLRAVEFSMELHQELHNVEMEAARLKRDEASTNNKVAMLQLKKVELELEQLNEVLARIPVMDILQKYLHGSVSQVCCGRGVVKERIPLGLPVND